VAVCDGGGVAHTLAARASVTHLLTAVLSTTQLPPARLPTRVLLLFIVQSIALHLTTSFSTVTILLDDDGAGVAGAQVTFLLTLMLATQQGLATQGAAHQGLCLSTLHTLAAHSTPTLPGD